MGTRMIFQGRASAEPRPEGLRRDGFFFGGGYEPPPQLRDLGSAVSSPAGSGAKPRRK